MLSGCSTTRYLEKDQYLVKKVDLVGIDKQYQETVYGYVQKDITPNSWFSLWLYNLMNTKNGKYRTDKIRKIGEAPHILDSSLVEISRTQIEKYLQTKGFFKAKVRDSIATKNKKAYLTFTAERGPIFRLRNFEYEIPDSAVKKLYENHHSEFTYIKKGKRYDADSLAADRERIYSLLKENGYFDYLRQYVRFAVDSNLNSSQADLKMFLDNPLDKDHHQVYTIGDTYMSILNSDGTTAKSPDVTLADSQYHFTDHSHRFSSKLLFPYIQFDRKEIFKQSTENRTYDRLYDLNLFKNIKVSYKKDTIKSELTPAISALPLKRMGNSITAEFTFNSGRSGFNIGDNYTNRNIFRGGELLEIKLKYGVLFDHNSSGIFGSIYNRDIELGANLIFPRLLVPFRKNTEDNKSAIPHTTVSASTQIFDQKAAFRNRIYIAAIAYDWSESKNRLHSLTPLAVEYRNGVVDSTLADSLVRNGLSAFVVTNNAKYFNTNSQYTFTYNTARLTTYDNFFYFKGYGELSGLVPALINTLTHQKDADGNRSIFGVEYLQYAKADVDLRYYKHLGGERQLVLRLNPAVIYPYSHNSDLPFEKNFYAGGQTGVRAWQARTLGPGNYNRASLESSLFRQSLQGLDQSGQVKIEGNIEYRFKLMNNLFGAKLKGALFSDYGNIWTVRDNGLDTEYNFQFNSFLKQMALGAGAGIRFDLQYFVFRFDAGLKIHDPQFIDPVYGESPWVVKKIFDQKDFKERYKTNNDPDRYNFVQYNFGIGMPF
ncbi:BamA/TamA family outer membrane protein [Pedobacter sp. HMF7647]|uniref:BamA/TamA family outer membrane protein n=1 Tax=Hufsiella arboris TaxID=2695275 RepID=A0A7K1YBF4_9SPHI|nr:BamA/TamA family outer membrane protein [Hufsiella arboris]